MTLDDEGVHALEVGRLVAEPCLGGGVLQDLGDVGQTAPLLVAQVGVLPFVNHVKSKLRHMERERGGAEFEF